MAKSISATCTNIESAKVDAHSPSKAGVIWNLRIWWRPRRNGRLRFSHSEQSDWLLKDKSHWRLGQKEKREREVEAGPSRNSGGRKSTKERWSGSRLGKASIFCGSLRHSFFPSHRSGPFVSYIVLMTASTMACYNWSRL